MNKWFRILVMCLAVAFMSASCSMTDDPDTDFDSLVQAVRKTDASSEEDIKLVKIADKEKKDKLKKSADKKVDINGNELVPGKTDFEKIVKFNEKFQKKLAKLSDEEEVEVDLFIRLPRAELDQIIHPNTSSMEIIDGKQQNIVINGNPATEAELEELNRLEQEKVKERLHLIKEKNSAAFKRLKDQEGIEINEKSTRIKVKKSKLKNIVNNHADIIRAIEENSDGDHSDGIYNALMAIGVSSDAWNGGFDGDNIGVWNNDGTGRPRNNSQIDPSDFTEHTPSEPLEDHATQTTAAVMVTAPEAHVHFAAGTGSCLFRDVTSYSNPDVFISTRSNDYHARRNSDGSVTNDSTYRSCTETYEDYVYDTRITHFQLAHNQNSFVGDIAKAFNVITVGGMDDNDNSTPFTRYGNSNWRDPETGADKPEIVAPAVELNIAGWSNITGTSFATPIAAGFAANLMEAYSYYRNRPHVMKASLMANATNDISGATEDQVGAGRLDWNRAYWNGIRRNWIGSNGSYFTSDVDGDGRKEILVNEYLYAGRTYRIAINWLVPGSYAANNLKPSMDIDLIVRRNGSWVASSSSGSQSYEMVEFVPSTTGTYQVAIERYWNSGQGNVILGYALTW